VGRSFVGRHKACPYGSARRSGPSALVGWYKSCPYGQVQGLPLRIGASVGTVGTRLRRYTFRMSSLLRPVCLPGTALLAASILAAPAFATALAPADPPGTRVDPIAETLHGEEVVDPYRWLEALEAESSEVREWTTAQNDHTRGVLDALPCRSALEKRLSELMTVDWIGAPVQRGTRLFHARRAGNQNQPVLVLVDVGAGGNGNGDGLGGDGLGGDAPAGRVLLDPNTLDDGGLVSLDWWVPSHDGNLLAFGLSRGGDEMTALHLMDVASGQWLADEIPGKVSFGGWMPDARGFLYSRLSDPADPYSRTIMFHEIGRHQRHNPALLVQENPSRIPFATLSRDGRWIVGGIFAGWTENDLFVVDADRWRRTGEFAMTPIATAMGARFMPSAIVGDTMVMTTTFESPNGAVFAVDLNRPTRDQWRPIVPHDAKAVISTVRHARGILAIEDEVDAHTRIRRYRIDGTRLDDLPLPGLGTASLSVVDDRTDGFVTYTSFNEPTSIYAIDLAGGEPTLWARPEIPVDPESIVVRQEWTTSKDGTRVPMFVVHRHDVSLDGDNPTLIYAYGGFNISLTPSFSAPRFAWLDAGGVYVTANLRGGGEFGDAWHKGGMLDRKQNVFDDLYAVAEHLIEKGYTRSERLAVLGGSNGGLLTGVAVTQRPDLFAAAISAVPLLDMLRYHQFLMARFWVPEYGSAEDPAQFEWLRAYSPYHNIEEGRRYPAVLFTAGENDNRVHPLHARKMAARMQAAAANDPSERPILLWVDRDSGHGAGKPLHIRIREAADTWGFLKWQTGLCQ